MAVAVKTHNKGYDVAIVIEVIADRVDNWDRRGGSNSQQCQYASKLRLLLLLRVPLRHCCAGYNYRYDCRSVIVTMPGRVQLMQL